MSCCCCPSAVSALFCLWVQSGFSKGTVAGALTFFPPSPPLYKFQRQSADGTPLADDEDALIEDTESDDQNSSTSGKKKKKKKRNYSNDELVGDEAAHYRAKEGEMREQMKSPAQQLTERAKHLRRQAKARNARDARDAKAGVTYSLVLDSRLSAPRLEGGGRDCVTCVKIPTPAKSHVAAIVYRVPQAWSTPHTKTVIYSHGNATDIGAMFPIQSILAHALECNVISYDYSGYGESGGVPMERTTYTDIAAVYEYTLKELCKNDASRIILYGQSVGSGPCCHLARNQPNLGGMILHSPFTSGMRVLTPSRLLACLDIYPNIDRIRKATCPVMVIHGRLDEEVSISHGVALHEAVPDAYKRDPWWVPDRGHNDITEGPGKLTQYVQRLRQFMDSVRNQDQQEFIDPQHITADGEGHEISTSDHLNTQSIQLAK